MSLSCGSKRSLKCVISLSQFLFLRFLCSNEEGLNFVGLVSSRSWNTWLLCNNITYRSLVFTKSVDSNFRAFWLAPVAWNILGYSLFCERREKWRFFSWKLQRRNWRSAFFYPSDLVNTKTTIPLRVGEERWIYTSTLRVSVYIHHYSPPLREIFVYYS